MTNHRHGANIVRHSIFVNVAIAVGRVDCGGRISELILVAIVVLFFQPLLWFLLLLLLLLFIRGVSIKAVAYIWWRQ